jgi:hypothetical protein
MAAFEGAQMRVLHLLSLVPDASSLSNEEKTQIFTQFAPRGEPADPLITLGFWNYALFCPQALNVYAQQMVLLVHAFMRGALIDKSAFLDAAREVMRQSAQANEPRLQCLQMGSVHSLAMGPLPINPSPPVVTMRRP